MSNNTKQSFTTHDIAYIAAGVAIIAVASWVYIPVGPVPFTLQTMAIAFVGLALSPKRALCTVVFYIVLGAVGMPVFSGMQGGIGVLFGPTGGYIWGFVLGMALCGFVRARQTTTDLSVKMQAVCCAILLIVTHTLGVVWLAYVSNITVLQACAIGSIPFLVPDVIKVVLGASAARGVTHALPQLAHEG